MESPRSRKPTACRFNGKVSMRVNPVDYKTHCKNLTKHKRLLQTSLINGKAVCKWLMLLFDSKESAKRAVIYM